MAILLTNPANKKMEEMKGMVRLEKKKEVIKQKLEGASNRAVAKATGLNRETVSKYWEEYKKKRHEILQNKPETDILLAQEELTKAPKYNTKNRKLRKYNEAIEKRLIELLESEKRKDIELGEGHKQKITNKQIYKILQEEKYEIGQSTINNALARLRGRKRQVYIRQTYDYGDRVEYDFGEVKLILGGELKVCHMAVFASTAGKYRWCRLYTNEKKHVLWTAT